MTEPVEPEILTEETEERQSEFVEEPAKVVRVGTMMRQLLEEVKSSPLDDQSRDCLLYTSPSPRDRG